MSDPQADEAKTTEVCDEVPPAKAGDDPDLTWTEEV